MMNYGTIKRQVVVEGDQVAFEAGEQVVIESIQPNQQNPAFKYVVLSNRLQKRFQLSDNDVQPAQAPQPQQPAPAQVPSLQKPARKPLQPSAKRPRARRAAFGWRTVVIIAVAVLVAAGLVVGLVLWSGKSKKIPATTWTNTGGAVSSFMVGPFAYDPAHNLLYAGCINNVSPNVYVGKGVWKYDGTTWTDVSGAVSNFGVESLAYDPTRDLLYASFKNESAAAPTGVWKFDGTTWADTGGGVSSDHISSLAYDSTHKILYAGTGQSGVWKYDGTMWIATAGGVSSFSVDSLAYDSAHNQLYAGCLDVSTNTCKGVWKYNGSNWSDTGGGLSKFSGNVIWSLTYDSTHNLLYAGTNFHGVWKYDGSTWTDTAGGVTKFTVWNLACDPVNNLVYAGTNENGVWRYDGSTWTTADAGSKQTDAALAYDSGHKVLYAGRSLKGKGLGAWKMTEVGGP